MIASDGWIAHQDAEGRTYYANAKGETTWTIPERTLPEGWTAHQDADGRTYYANSAGQTTWTIPECPLPSGWTQHRDAGGHAYYANSITGETTWERPIHSLDQSEPLRALGTTLLASKFIEQCTDMPEMAKAIGDAQAQQLRKQAVGVQQVVVQGLAADVSAAVYRLVRDSISLPIVSPLVAEVIAAAIAAVAGLVEPGLLCGGEAIGPPHVIRVLEELARVVTIFQPAVFSVLCRAGAVENAGYSDVSARRTQVALSGACTWLFAAFCRTVGYSELTADVLWEWANCDALWVALLAKSTLELDELIDSVPDTPLKGVLTPSDLGQLQDVVAGAVFGLVGPIVVFAHAVSEIDGGDTVDEIVVPNVQFARHWAKLAVAIRESGLIGPLLKATEGVAYNRRIHMADFFAKLLNAELFMEPPWISEVQTETPIVEAAQRAAVHFREALCQYRDRLWALLATGPTTGRIPRGFLKNCSELAFHCQCGVTECANFIRGFLADTQLAELAHADSSSLAALCVLAANARVVPGGDGDDLLSDFLLSVQPDVRISLAAHLAEWSGPVAENVRLCWIEFLSGTQQPVSVASDGVDATPVFLLETSHRQALGMGGLEQLLNDVPVGLSCSLDGQLLTNPVRSPFGYVYEYSVLVSALAQNGGMCPHTGQQLMLEHCQRDWDVKRKSDAHIKRWARGIID